MTSQATDSVSQMSGKTFSPEIYKKVQDTISQLSVALKVGSKEALVANLHPIIVVLPTVDNIFILLQVNDDGMKEFMIWAKDKQVAASDNFVAIPLALDENFKANPTLSKEDILQATIASANQAVLDLLTYAPSQKESDTATPLAQSVDNSVDVAGVSVAAQGASALDPNIRLVKRPKKIVNKDYLQTF